MKHTTNNLPPKLRTFASPLNVHPPQVQEAFHLLLATAVHEAGKFEFASVAEVEGGGATLSGTDDVFKKVI